MLRQFRDPAQMAYFPCHDNVLKNKWVLFRGVAQDIGLSFRAREKLEWIIFFNTVGERNVTKTALYYGISRKTFHKWLRRFNDKNLRSLEEVSRSPHSKRSWMVTKQEEDRIISLRKLHLKWGKNKLKVLYKKEYKKKISTWKIERVIRYHKLFPDPEKHMKLVKNKARRKERLSIYDIERKEDFGFLWHIDAVIIWWYGSRRVIFTAIEDLTKIAFARIYTTNNSSFAEDFLKRLMYLSQQKVEIMHSDNGSEFKDKLETACRLLGVIQAYSRPRTPTDNPSLERFNRTIQEEWLELSEVGLDDIPKANLDLTNWLIEYNNVRPHQALDYQTPLEYTYQNFPQVLPMFPASTKICNSKRERVLSRLNMVENIWKGAPATSVMVSRMEVLQLDKAVEPVITLVREAYGALPFELDGSGDKNEQTLSAFLKNTELLAQVIEEKGLLAVAANTVLENAYTHFGAKVLPKYSDVQLDISQTYWDEVQGKIRGQFEELSNIFNFKNLVINMELGMLLRIYTYPNGHSR